MASFDEPGHTIYTSASSSYPAGTGNSLSDVRAITTAASQIWQVWNDVTTGSATTTNSVFDTWARWSAQTTDSETMAHVLRSWVGSQEQVREAEQRRQARRRREEQQWLQRKKQRKVAGKRADKILVEHLSRLQRRQLEKLGFFDVEVAGRKFRIHNNKYQHNVFELDDENRPVREFCAHTSHACPQSDHALAQKLMLESALDEFCRVANVWDRRNGRRELVSESGRELRVPQRHAHGA